ncbi:MAG: MFS transporter, partial [Actinomycetes bacterium]
SDTAGMVARGEAVGGEEAERLAAELSVPPATPSANSSGAASDAPGADTVQDDDGGLVSQRR